MTYEKLLDKCNELGISVKEIELKSSDGLCRGNRIAINKSIETIKEKKCVLAEELGHYHLTVGDIRDQDKIENKKQEFKARRYGYSYIVEPIDIVQAFRDGAMSFHDIAEYIDVPESYLTEIIEDFKKQYGYGCRVGNYYLMLEPKFGVLKDMNGLFK